MANAAGVIEAVWDVQHELHRIGLDQASVEISVHPTGDIDLYVTAKGKSFYRRYMHLPYRLQDYCVLPPRDIIRHELKRIQMEILQEAADNEDI